jgi:hypothetical protein
MSQRRHLRRVSVSICVSGEMERREVRGRVRVKRFQASAASHWPTIPEMPQSLMRD